MYIHVRVFCWDFSLGSRARSLSNPQRLYSFSILAGVHGPHTAKHDMLRRSVLPVALVPFTLELDKEDLRICGVSSTNFEHGCPAE